MKFVVQIKCPKGTLLYVSNMMDTLIPIEELAVTFSTFDRAELEAETWKRIGELYEEDYLLTAQAVPANTATARVVSA